jgi:putative spermidine/putrescine transport system permease protein
MKFLFRPVFLGLFVFWIFFPFLSIIIWSVAAGWRFPDILPKQYSARGYAVSLDPNGDIVQGAITSTVIALIVGLLATAIGSAAGRAIAMYTFKMKKIFQFLVLAPLIVPGLAVTMGIQILFIKYGLSDTIRGVILAHLIPTIPYVVMIMSGTFANFDKSYEEQGQVLGATRATVLRKITLPIILPGLAVSFLFAFVISWSEYILTLLVGGAAVKTLPMVLFAFLRGSDLTLVGAASIVFMIPPLILLRFTSKHLVGRTSSVTGLGSV